MNFIKKIYDGKIEASDNSVHLQFQKFSRGEFQNRALVKVKRSGDKYTINTSSEFANEFAILMAQKLGSKTTNVTGAIVSTSDLKGKVNFKEIKQFQGVKRYILDGPMSGNEITKLMSDFPKCFFALSFTIDENNVLKVKAKAPKSGKPASKNKDGEEEEMITPDFCKLITNDKTIGQSFVVEKSDFKAAEFKHTYVIEQIVIPPQYKNEKDFAIVREKSLRKGKIIREGAIDDQKIKSEMVFEA
ncbi:hypothetical protein COU57_04185 [Candidatus Pacearchaeota archaeon CG10_big_fil_rev_8_21_14_0_10_32_14]|nr:MAG: hypothetical protein COU57_04185 [Candidatus Pacearchaeota archaeon CG10_big_fil_rev_8_21_14_0_10_32_14]